MKRRILRFERFLVWVYLMSAGEKRRLKPIEIVGKNPKLSANGFQVFPLQMVTKGSFRWKQGDKELGDAIVGDGCRSSIDLSNLTTDIVIEAMSEHNEYHCIFPLDNFTDYWNRQMVREPMSVNFTEQFLYVGAGQVDCGSQAVTGGNLMNMSQHQMNISPRGEAIAALFYR